MGSKAISGVGTKFYRWNSSSWGVLAEITAINGPGMSRETIDVTSLDTVDGYREFISSFRDGGTLSLSMNFTRTTYDLMKEDFESDEKGNYEIILPDDESTSIEFEGLVTELPLAVAADDKITTDVTIKVSGKVVVNSGHSSGLTP